MRLVDIRLGGGEEERRENLFPCFRSGLKSRANKRKQSIWGRFSQRNDDDDRRREWGPQAKAFSHFSRYVEKVVEETAESVSAKNRTSKVASDSERRQFSYSYDQAFHKKEMGWSPFHGPLANHNQNSLVLSLLMKLLSKHHILGLVCLH